MATGATPALWKLLAAVTLLLVLFIAHGTSASVVASSRLRRVHKSTYSEAAPPDSAAMQSIASGRAGAKAHPKEGHVGVGRLATAKKPTVTTMKSTGTTLRQRVDQAVQMVRARSKEIKMEQEQKRVDRKLRRDEKKQEREQSAVAAPLNPHNLKMPDCPAGKVYNGRRCVAMGKMPKH
uniref:Uncharacterized protein n=1 Tax=Anopheles melas TaxID=34690 RepID=A0A182TCV8_9DIPT